MFERRREVFGRGLAGRLGWSIAIALGVLLVGETVAQPRFSFATAPGALSKDIVPLRYALQFDLDPARSTFTGQATIVVRVDKPVPALVLHAHELEADAATLQSSGDTAQALRIVPGKVSQTWQLRATDAAPIAPGEHTLRIVYRGKVQRTGQGLYSVEHKVQGQPQQMLATQLQAVYARTLFPCFDEPAFRAVFDIAVKAPAGYEVLSNMPLARQEPAEGGQWHHFEPTPAMSSYLVALSVGRFDALDSTAAGVPLRILSAPGKREQARYAMSVTEQVVPYYNDYFGLPYALPKLDQLAVAGVRDGAMEDWGLISYSEPAILFDPSRSSPKTRRWVFDTIAHEIAHQWFGNLVTAASWDEIWLNEAFATWMAAKATARFNPAWQSELHRRQWIDRAMARDATRATRAIRSGPVRESAVFDVFDNITYTKGGAVLSMLEQWIGPEVFRRGLVDYMQGQKLSNATAGDLWYHMAQASGRPVTQVAASWTDQRGFPLVRLVTRCVAGRTEITLAQQRFWLGAGTRERALWKIPVLLARGTQQAKALLDSAGQRVWLEGCSADPVLANAGGVGFYRVEYAAADRRRAAAAFAALAPADRVALLSDSFALAQAGRLPLPAYFGLLSALPTIQDESRGTLFTMAIDALQLLDRAMRGTPAQPRVRAAGRALLAPALRELGWQPRAGESDESTALRAALIGQLARFDDADTLRQAFEAFDADASSQVPLQAAIRAAVIQAVGVQPDRARFDRLVAALQAAGGEEDRWMYASALAQGRDAAQARALLDLSLSGQLPGNIAAALPGLVSEHSPHPRLAYDFVLKNWDRLATLAGGMFGARETLLPDAASGFNEVAQARSLVADQRAKAGRDGDASAARVAQRIELLARLRQRDAATLAAFLAQR
jgi:aminopeptidase N